MSGRLVVLDSGALGEAATNTRFRTSLAALVRTGFDPVIPTPVLAEAITGRATDAPVNLLVRRLGTVVTGEATARRAGHLRTRAIAGLARRAPSGIDAIVAAHAVEADQAVVFTTDAGDLRRLLADYPAVVVEKP